MSYLTLWKIMQELFKMRWISLRDTITNLNIIESKLNMKIRIRKADIRTMRCSLKMQHFANFRKQDKRKKQLFQRNVAKP